MASQLEIATTRENAKKSTGLTTSEGKSITSRNALKAGLDAKSEILRFENRAELYLLT